MSDIVMLGVLAGSIGLIGLLLHWCGQQIAAEE